VNFDEWEADVPALIKGDTAWRVEAYRLALFLSDLAWQDTAPLTRNRRAAQMADQLIRAAGKVSSDIIEGYSRGTGKGRAIFYEYALGSAREARDWYYKLRFALKPEVVEHRINLCTKIIRLLLKMISNERKTNRPIS
jgi:four helix bundle protein